MHTKIWRSYVHIRYLVHVQKWTYLALGWPYGWALNFKYIIMCIIFIRISVRLALLLESQIEFCVGKEWVDRWLAPAVDHLAIWIPPQIEPEI